MVFVAYNCHTKLSSCLAVSNDIATLAPVFAQSDGDNNLPLSMIWGQTQLDSQLSSDAQLSVIDTLEISASSRNISSNHFDFVSGSPSNTDSSAVFCESPRAKSLVGTFGYMVSECECGYGVWSLSD